MSGSVTPVARTDISVLNDSTVFVVASSSALGAGALPGDAEWDAGVQSGRWLPFELTRDVPFVIRVVHGDLTADESAEWVGAFRGCLDLRDGTLIIGSGIECIVDGVDVSTGRRTRRLEVPAAYYQAELHAYPHGVNGDALIARAAGAEPAPHHHGCGHAAPRFIDFVLKLTLIDAPTSNVIPRDAFFSVSELDARIPPVQPQGILLAASSGANRFDASLDVPTSPVDVLEPAAEHEMHAVVGGPCTLPMSAVLRVIRLARFTSDGITPGIRIDLPPGAEWSLSAEASAELGVCEISAGDTVVLAFERTATKWGTLGCCDHLASSFESVPDGSVLEIAAFDEVENGTPPPGLHRYSGTVRGRSWLIDHAYPAVDAAVLRAALDLAAEVEQGLAVTAATEDEAAAVQRIVEKKWDFLLASNPLRREGACIVLSYEDVQLAHLIGAAAFRLRFSDWWPVAEAERDDDIDHIIDEAVRTVQDALLRTTQLGEMIFEGGGSRKYHRATIAELGYDAEARAREADAGLADLGFTVLGDLVCTALPDIYVRGYAHPTGDTYGVLILGPCGQETFELATCFSNESALTTTRTEGAGDDAATGQYRSSLPEADFADLLAVHEERKKSLAAICGAPRIVAARLDALAEAIERALAKQLGG